MPTYVGLDLAWTAYHPSGICVIEETAAGSTVRRLASALWSVEELAWLLDSFPADVIVAVDAPLLIGEQRVAERELARVYGTAHASAYSPSRDFLARFGGMAGPALCAQLLAAGFSHAPEWPSKPPRTLLEVYPHAAHVGWFGLRHRLPYKKGRRETRLLAFAEYQVCLSGELDRLFPRIDRAQLSGILTEDPAHHRGIALKAFEDKLDALTCALMAKSWADGETRTFGSAEHGAIITPKAGPGTYVPSYRGGT